MDQQVNDFWSNTLNAQTGTYQGLSDFNMGNYFLSIFLVIGLLLLILWLFNKLGWLKKQQPIDNDEERVLFYAQFNQNQTLLITENQKKINCIVLKGKQMELVTELPMLTAKQERVVMTGPSPKKRSAQSFQEIWTNVLQSRKGKK